LVRASCLLCCVAALVASGLLASGRGAVAAGGSCDLYASANGRDRNSGRAGTPVRTLGRLIAGLRAGQVGCVEAGTRFSEHVTVASGGAPGSPARIRGAGTVLNGVVRVTRDGHDLVIEDLQVRGDGSAVDAIVSIAGPRITLSHVAVDGPNYHDANVACIRLDGRAEDVVLRWVVAHDCTRAKRKDLYAPGIVVASARGTRIVDSIVYHAFGDAIVLAPNARGTRISQTLLDGNSSGIYLAGRSSGNVIANNIISFSGRYGVHGDGGRGNIVTGNCIWRGYTANVAGRGFRAYGNLAVSPRYVRRAPIFEMRPGPCTSRRPGARGATPGVAQPRVNPAPKPEPKPKPRPKPKPPARLARFTVHYTLRAVPNRVQVVNMTFTGLAPGATLELRCRSGCGFSERLVADPNGSATTATLLGRWLVKGAVIVASERRGAAKATATITVTGLPNGLRVTHG
jgi:parallel beta helix pectate lyase-like protein